MAYDSGLLKAQSALAERVARADMLRQQEFQKQSIWLTYWQQIAEIFYPERADFTQTWSDALHRHDGLFTGEPQMMRSRMATRLGAIIRPRGRPWFRVTAKPDYLMREDEHRRWCEEATGVQRNIVYAPSANFTRAMQQDDEDFVAFGSSITRVGYNSTQTGVLFRNVHLKDVAWSENAEGVVDHVHERLKLTLRQVVELFGLERLPREWRKQFEKEPQAFKTVFACAYPIEKGEWARGERPGQNMAFSGVYYAEDGAGTDDRALGESHFLTLPYVVRRWMTVSGEVYGRSPCTSVALGDARMLNTAQAMLLRGIEMKVDPPVTVRDGVVLSELSLQPGKYTTLDDNYDERFGAPVKPIEIGDPRYGMEFTQVVRETMGRAFLENVLNVLPDKEMTAYEAARYIEKYTEDAAPLFEPLEADNARLMDAVFTRALAKGAFGEVPQGLQGAEVGFEFETPRSDGLRRKLGAEAERAFMQAQVIGQTFPEALDLFNHDEAMRDLIGSMGATRWLRTPDQVAAAREQRAAALQAQQDQAMAMQAADMALKARPEALTRVAGAAQAAGDAVMAE